MQDFKSDSNMLLNPSDIVVPKGWAVLSHGTSFHKWNNPLSGIPAQDLKKDARITINNTLDGGLTCFDEHNRQLSGIYAGQDEPVIFKVFVPGDLKNFDPQTGEDALRFIKPTGLDSRFSLIPAETKLVKLAEDITDRPGDTSVIWYVPEQFYSFLKQDLIKLNSQKANVLNEDKSESDFIFDINRSFASAEEASKEEHILEQEEKADEYFEDLEEQQQLLLDEEVSAEEKLAAKRAKDKANARAQDKRNFAAAEAEHQQQMAEANSARERNDVYSFESSPSGYETTTFKDNEPTSSESYVYSEPYTTPDPNPGSDNVVPYENLYSTEGVSPSETKYVQDDSHYRQKSAVSQGAENDRSSSVAYTYDVPKYNQESFARASEPDYLCRQQKEDEYEALQNKRREDAVRFQESLQEEARQRQQKSDSYKSFGHSGIDFSGKENHNSYAGSTPKHPAQSITPEEFNNLENDFYHSRKKFRSYSGAVPDDVTSAYKAASDRYFAIQKQIAAGSVVVTQSSSVPNSKHSNGVGGNANAQDPHNHISVNSDTHIPKATSPSHTTVQNVKAGVDAPGRREGASLKDPPKSPVGSVPLAFSEEKFRALRRFGSSVSDRSLRVTSAVKNQVVQTAYSEETGTAQTVTKFSQGISEMTVVLDCFAGGSGKKEAAKIWSQYVADSNGTKARGIDKQAVKDYGKINIKTVDGKLKEPLTESDLKSLRKKFGTAANVSVADAVGTHNGRIGKAPVFVDGKVNVRIAEGKVGALRTKSSNLKSQIKELQSKGSALTGAERQRLSDLMATKKATDQQLRNMVSATNARHKTERFYRQINGMSPRKVEKEIKKLEKNIKKGSQLNRVQKQQLNALKERNANLKMREKLGGRGKLARTARLGGIAVRHLGKFMRNSDDETFSTMMSMTGRVGSASRFATNRYVKRTLKWTVKAALTPARLAARMARSVDRKYGVSKAVGKTISKPINAAKSKLLHTKPVQKFTSSRFHNFVQGNGGLRKSVAPGLKKLAPNKAKLAAKKVRNLFQRLNKNPVVRGVKGIISAPFKGLQLLNSGINFVKGFLTKYIAIPIALLFIGAGFVTAIATVIAGVGGGTEEGEGSVGGRINIAPYVETMNEEQADIDGQIEAFKNDTEANGGTYKNVYVNYVGGAGSNNYREIISLTSVRKRQFRISDEETKDYMISLYNASNYVFTEESDPYYCSGCEERSYKCTDELDEFASQDRINTHNKYKRRGGCQEYQAPCEQGGQCQKSYCIYNQDHLMNSVGDCNNYRIAVKDGKTYYQCLGHSYCPGHIKYKCDGNHVETICRSHIDLYVSVGCLGLEELFAVDPDVQGSTSQGELLGTFKITYYCAEKYPHICNAGPPYQTASGTIVTPGRTVAVDKEIIPLGTKLIINGHTYTAEDTGGAIVGNRIDIAVSTHQEALNAGIDVFNVYKESLSTEAPDEDAEDEGWTEYDKEWARTIYENMTADVYYGLELIGKDAPSNSVVTEDLKITGSKVNVSYYSQHDPRWGSSPVRYDYPQHTISAAGCGFTSMSIIVSSMTDNQIDPSLMCANYGTTYYKPGVGAYWSIVSGVSADYGLTCEEMTLSVQNVIDALNDGKLVVAVVGDGGAGYTGKGYYTGAGHFLVICGVTDDGKLLLADPNNATVSTSGQGVDMQHFLDSGIKTWWSISK